ncbi:c-type cytochrome [Sulfurovum sp. XGS-02]|uniref:c-type cytochrome n=1 Tax=Sulfurovum sp. XGS-02 TaxID=2925411 RepID=UPI00205DFFC5|nr:c-type cytochrome [Sulfurovum sp. XGS-02]UPT77753.1 c-type cytochrome [Sulfurovum sp. XGS-02]
MKKITLLSLAAAAVLFTACGEETKKVAAEVNTTKVAQAIKEDTLNAVETTKTTISEAASAAKVEAEKMADAAAETAAAATMKVAEAVEEKAAEVGESASKAMASETVEAPAAYAKCTGCHGANGKTKALGKSAVIAGQDKEALITSLKEYKAGTKNVAGMGSLMKAQVATMSDEEIEAVAEYLSQIQ